VGSVSAAGEAEAEREPAAAVTAAAAARPKLLQVRWSDSIHPHRKHYRNGGDDVRPHPAAQEIKFMKKGALVRELKARGVSHSHAHAHFPLESPVDRVQTAWC
jgi:hypothetical protein